MDGLGLMGQLSLTVFLGALLIALIFACYLLFQRFLKGSDRKAIQNKALLKSLLEDFELDVPLELQNSNGNASVKSFKKI